jgi:hypothetical protein
MVPTACLSVTNSNISVCCKILVNSTWKGSLRQMLTVVVPISTGVIAISLAFAFSSRIRHPFYYLFSCMSIYWAYFTEYTYLHFFFSWCFRKPSDEMRRDHRKAIERIHARREINEIRDAMEKAGLWQGTGKSMKTKIGLDQFDRVRRKPGNKTRARSLKTLLDEELGS